MRSWLLLCVWICVALFTISCSSVDDNQNSQQEDHMLRLSLHSSEISTTAEIALYSEEIRAIHERGYFIVEMFSGDRPPFFYVNDEGQLAGSDVELARSIAAAFGVEARFNRSAASFDQVVDRIAAGEGDIAVSKLSQTLDRGKKVLFSDPYLNLELALLINRVKLAEIMNRSQSVLEIIASSKEKIGVIQGTSYVDFAENIFPHAQLMQYETKDQLYQAALNGDILAALYDEFEIRTHIDNHPHQSIELQILIVEGKLDPISIAVGAQNQHLQAWLNLYLKNYRFEIESMLKAYEIVK